MILCVAALSAFVLLSSCQKSRTEQLSGIDGRPAFLTLCVSGPGGNATKVASQTENNENTINSVQVFVFNASTGQIDNAVYKGGLSATGTFTLEPLKCTVGDKTVWAIVNAPADYVSAGAVKTLSDLVSIKMNLSDNGPSSLIMSGTSEVTLTPGSSSLEIGVARLCAAVVLKEVQNEMSVPSYASKVNLTGAYLMNAPAVQKIDGGLSSDAAESQWCAFFQKAGASEPASLLVESIGPVNIPVHGSHTQTHTFYTFSNIYDKVPFEGGSPYAKCSTYLIVECTVDGVACIYPIVMPQINANCKYNVTLRINHVGGDPSEPWKEIKSNSFTPTISVEPWMVVPVSETI